MTEVGGRFSRAGPHRGRGDDGPARHPGWPVRLLVAASSASAAERSGFAAAIALTVTMLPIIARSAEVALRSCPGGLREAEPGARLDTLADGVAGRLPTAAPGLATALILGRRPRHRRDRAGADHVGRVARFLQRQPGRPNPMNSLPLYIYTAVRSGQPLVHRPRLRRRLPCCSIIVLVLFVVTRLLARADKAATSRRQHSIASACRTGTCGLTDVMASCLGRAPLRCRVSSRSASVGRRPTRRRSHAQINGSGSTWAANAVNQWIADVQPQGLQVIFTATGSAQGRQTSPTGPPISRSATSATRVSDPTTGQIDTSNGRPYAYVPMVAGGTAFPYHIMVGGKQVTNLRLSGLTLAKIFTNQITNWDDPAITADNNGHALPRSRSSRWCTPRARAPPRSSPTYLATEYPSIWRPFSGSRASPSTSRAKGPQIAQNGSDGVMNYVASRPANGAIGYDEYSYALASELPGRQDREHGGLLHAARPSTTSRSR